MREEGVHKIEVHVGGLCFDKKDGEWRCLIGRRASNRSLYPDLWEGGGGQVHAGESFEEALLRQMQEEFGVDVTILFPLAPYCIKTDDALIPGIKFVCALREKQTAKVDEKEIVEAVWISQEDIEIYELIPGVKEDLHRGFMTMEKFP